MSARLLDLLERLPWWARRCLMIVLPLVLLGVLVAGFVFAPLGSGHHSERASATGRVLPPSPTNAAQASARPAPPTTETGREPRRGASRPGARTVERGRARRVAIAFGGR